MVRIPYLNNLCLADIESIGVMKMETMLRRAKFRDYYDIYCILEQGCDIWKMIEVANPVYDIAPLEIDSGVHQGKVAGEEIIRPL